MNPESTFIKAVHQKIRQKKRQQVRWSGLIAISFGLFIIFSSYRTASGIRDENWSLDDLYQYEFYEWEYLEELTDDEILIFLMDVNDSDEIFDLADHSADILLAMQSIKWE